MAVRIRSLLVSGPLVVPLSSGVSVRLSPGAATDELADVEVANNAKIDELQELRLIDLELVAEESPEQAPEPVPEEPPEPAQQRPAGEEAPPAAQTRATKAPRAETRARQR
jgi:hypothetical protein